MSSRLSLSPSCNEFDRGARINSSYEDENVSAFVYTSRHRLSFNGALIEFPFFLCPFMMNAGCEITKRSI